MKGRNRAILSVRHQHGDAIRRLDSQQYARFIGHQTVALQYRGLIEAFHVVGPDATNQGGMDLVQRNHS